MFLIGVAALVVVAIVLLPLRLPWPELVRWSVSSQSMGYVGAGLFMYLLLDLREVALLSVESHSTRLTVGVLEAQHRASDTMFFVATTEPAPELESMLREWCVLRTPMLLHIDAAGVASLHGPAAAIGELRRLDVRTPQDA